MIIDSLIYHTKPITNQIYSINRLVHIFIDVLYNFFALLQFISSLKDNLNAEVALGTVTNVKEACAWLGYTYLFIRMKMNPLAYGIGWDEVLFLVKKLSFFCVNGLRVTLNILLRNWCSYWQVKVVLYPYFDLLIQMLLIIYTNFQSPRTGCTLCRMLLFCYIYAVHSNNTFSIRNWSNLIISKQWFSYFIGVVGISVWWEQNTLKYPIWLKCC